MRDTIDFGIDLGTTNSAVAVVDGGEPRVIKNNEDSEFTPSAVWLPRPGTAYVGRQAREATEKDPDSVALEFKRKMGLADEVYRFERADVTLTPPQLSAEVLSSLRRDVEQRLGVLPEAAVITVPAAFALNQNSATSEAATLAGFSLPCPLLQEPTAAAFAYGFRDADERAYCMVFDFGGGTFDSAVVSKRDGELRVLNHAGHPYLGGKEIDWAIVERLLVPAVTRDLGLADFHQGNRVWRKNYAKLKLGAEKAKIQLSRQQSAEILLDLDDGRGGIEPFLYTLRQGEVDQLAEPFYLRAIRCCRDALTEGGLRPDDIDRLLLVGGATLAPGLRERLEDLRHGLGIRLDYSQDPTTVVALGAALFASTVRVERPVPAPRPGEFTVELSYDAHSTSTTPMVAGRLYSAGPVDWTTYQVSLHNPDGRPPFHSARIGLTAQGAFATEVVVPRGATSRFSVELRNAAGQRQRLRPDTLTIAHGELEFGGAVLTHSLGIGTASNSFIPMLRKGTALPARVRERFQTSIALHRSDAHAMIRIPVVEGEQARTDRNLEVAVLEIRPRDIRIDLPAGSDVEVTFEIDDSRLVSVIADVPVVRAQFEAEIDLSNVRAPDSKALTEQLNEVQARLARLREQAADQPVAQEHLERLRVERSLDHIRDQVRGAAANRDAALAADHELRSQQVALDAVEDAVRVPALVRGLQDGLDACSAEVERHGRAEDQRELDELRRQSDSAIRKGDPEAVEQLIKQVGEFYIRLLRRRPDWPVTVFTLLCEQRDMMRPAVTAQRLIDEGERARDRGDYRALTEVNQKLRGLMPPDAPELVGGLIPR